MQRESPRQRPIDLGLLHLRLPVGAVVSILHRVSGVALILVFPAALWLLCLSRKSAADFERVRGALSGPLAHVALAAGAWLLAHHFYAGVRHLLLDLDVGSSRRIARRSAYLVFILGLMTALWVTL